MRQQKQQKYIWGIRQFQQAFVRICAITGAGSTPSSQAGVYICPKRMLRSHNTV